MFDFTKEYTILKIEFNDGERKSFLSAGHFVDPTDEEIKVHRVRPYKIFEPTDGSYRVSFYDEDQILKAIR